MVLSERGASLRAKAVATAALAAVRTHRFCVRSGKVHATIGGAKNLFALAARGASRAA